MVARLRAIVPPLMMTGFLKGLAHLIATLVVAVIVIPVIVTIVFALAGAYDYRIVGLPMGILWFLGYWFWRGVKGTKDDLKPPPVELPPDQRR